MIDEIQWLRSFCVMVDVRVRELNLDKFQRNSLR